LHSRRDSMSDEVVENMMAGYGLVDKVLADDTDIVTSKHAAYLLELNHTVLCGLDPRARKEHQRHVDATITRFYTQTEFNIETILRWYRDHRSESPWKRAAGVYVRLLSQPQLYIEGNHRTGALIMSSILARDCTPPFVLTVENAKAYFDPSTLMKETKKTALTELVKFPGMKKRFANFLRGQENAQYLILNS